MFGKSVSLLTNAAFEQVFPKSLYYFFFPPNLFTPALHLSTFFETYLDSLFSQQPLTVSVVIKQMFYCRLEQSLLP